MQLEGLSRKVFIDPHAPPSFATLEQMSRLRVRPHGHVIVEVQQHCGMALDSEQHVREAAEHIRANGFTLEAARNSEYEILIDGNGEVVRPEVREALDKRTIGADTLTESRAGLRYVDGSVDLADLH
jgi:hypothetical protein